MDFSRTVSSQASFTFEDAVTFLVNHPLGDPVVKECYAVYKGKPTAPGLTYSIAYRLFQQQVGQKSNTNLYPPHALAVASTRSVVTVTPTAVTFRNPVTLQDEQLRYKAGVYAAPEDQTVGLRAHVADALAYTYTNDKLSTHHIASSNFTNKDVKVGLPSIMAEQPVLPTWSTKVMENAQTLYNSMDTPAKVKQTATLLSPLAAQLSVVHPKASTPLVGTTAHVILPYYITPKGVSQDVVAYKILSLHRAVRGEDNSGLSSLTAGYYMGGMCRSMALVYMRVADILYVARKVAPKIIVLDPEISLAVGKSLVANGWRVVLLSVSTVNYKTADEVRDWLNNPRPPLFLADHTTKFSNVSDVLYVNVGLKGSTQYQKDSVVFTPQMGGAMAAFASRGGTHVLTWWGISDKLIEICKGNEWYILPSTHAHSGQVMVLRSKVAVTHPKMYDGRFHYSRMVTANIYKTHFPFSRCRFYETDLNVFQYDNDNLNGIALDFLVTRKVRVELQLEDYDATSDVPDRDDEYTPAMVVLKDVRLPYSDSPVPSVVPSAPPPDVVVIDPVAVVQALAIGQYSTTTTTTTTTAPSVTSLPPEIDLSSDISNFNNY